MSIASEITRLTDVRNTMRNTLVNWGVALTTDGFDNLATKLGEVTNQGAVQAEVQEGQTYTIPRGYHNGSGTVGGVAGGGNYTLQAKTVTPTKSQQNITSDQGYYGLSAVTVDAIPAAYQDVSGTTATAADVLATKTFVASDGTTTAGTMTNNGALALTIDGLTTTSVDIPSGYTSGGTVSLTSDIEDALAAL